ncbi:hypothetical protein N780_03965 [Pontibacillus chungwhensis BH030062]|uniref:Uncharacterized protein n=1 Tax=Pontibacillus chungwhensis BH030062 TaxID=1385513 RepID=A0A0A2UV52_9BACI|nr:hypothetical protein [Pontibacillus chungwhensis]KGP90653.1 hypothetical protein N780_03965 [Pontibacillus chungwhensis BH030062]
MTAIFIIIFIIGILIVGLAVYMGRNIEYKQFTWLSYLSLCIPIFLLMLMYLIPSSASGILLIGLPVGTFISLICCTVGLFKKDEKNILVAIGLFLTLILTSVIVIFGIFLFTPYAP